MTNKERIKSSINIELHPRHRLARSVSTPSFWEIVRFTIGAQKGKKCKNFVAGNICFFYGSAAGLSANVVPGNKAAEDKFANIIDQLYKKNPQGSAKWIVLPDGTIFTEDDNSVVFFTMKETNKGWVRLPMPDVAKPTLTSLWEPEWGEFHKVMRLVEKETVAKWRALRRERIKELKANGEWSRAKKARKGRALASKTNRKMRVCNQVRTVIQELEQYLKDVQDGTATRKQVGELYYEMSQLSSMNKKIKTLFPKE